MSQPPPSNTEACASVQGLTLVLSSAEPSLSTASPRQVERALTSWLPVLGVLTGSQLPYYPNPTLKPNSVAELATLFYKVFKNSINLLLLCDTKYKPGIWWQNSIPVCSVYLEMCLMSLRFLSILRRGGEKCKDFCLEERILRTSKLIL